MGGGKGERGQTLLLSGNARMRPQDWKCGDKLWIVEVLAPFGGTDEMLKDLNPKVFPEREVRFRTVEGGVIGEPSMMVCD